MNMGIDLRGIRKSYDLSKREIVILEDTNLSVPPGDFIAIMGPSGSGKTTLLNLMGGIDRPDQGEIHAGSQRIDTLSESSLTRWRAAHVGFIFQFYNLLPMLTAAQNVELPLLLTNLSGSQRRQRVDKILNLMGLIEHRSHLPSEMSGGQQQRIGIARAIAADPDLLLCDEPTGDLDRGAAGDILRILQTLNADLGKTVVMVTHDEVAAAYAKHVVHLDKGTFLPAGGRS